MILRTSLGKEYNVNWCAVSSIDGCLRFEITDITFIDAFNVFGNSDETFLITLYIDDVNFREYSGYTKLIGVNGNENITVSLIKENNE